MPNINGGFDVLGSYTYGEALVNATFSVQVSNGVATVGGSGVVSVADVPLVPGALTPPQATAGTTFSNVQLFHFTDSAGSYANVNEYTAVIVWGDGTTSTVTSTASGGGQIVQTNASDPPRDSTCSVRIHTRHNWPANFSVQVSDADGETTSASASENDFAVGVPSITTSNGILTANSSVTTAVPLTVDAGGATVNTNGYDVTLTGNISDGTGSGGVAEVGGGTLTVSGNNTYSGGTTVASGTLVVSGASSLPSSGVLVVGRSGMVVLGNSLRGQQPQVATASTTTSTVAATPAASLATTSTAAPAAVVTQATVDTSTSTSASTAVVTSAQHNHARQHGGQHDEQHDCRRTGRRHGCGGGDCEHHRCATCDCTAHDRG